MSRPTGHISLTGLAVSAGLLAAAAVPTVAVSLARRPPEVGHGGIVSLTPALTDMLFQVGAGDQVVAVSRYCRLPAGVRRPRVGDAFTLNGEAIVGLGPRVIVAQLHPTDLMRMLERDYGIGYEQVHLERIADLAPTLRLLARVANRPVDSVEPIITRIDAELAAVRGRVAGLDRPAVLIAIGIDRPLAVGRGTFLDDLVEAAGGHNALAEPGYVVLNEENVLRLKPEVIIDLADSLAGQGADSPPVRFHYDYWRAIGGTPAARSGRIFVVTDPTLTVPGTHVGATAAKLADMIHPPQGEGADRP